MKKLLGLLILLFIASPSMEAQRFKDARSYYREFQSQNRKISIKNMRYLESVVKELDARRINKFREMVVDQLKDSKRKLSKVGPYKGDDVLHREYMESLDLYLEAFEKDFGAAEELTAKRYDSYEDLQKYYETANAAEMKMLDAAFKIEKAEDFFGKTYTVDLRRDSATIYKQEKLDEITVYTREITLIYFRVDAELRALFKAIEADKADTLGVIITNMRKSLRAAQTEVEGIEPFEYDGALEDQLLYYLEEIDASIDEELRPMAEAFQFKYKDQADLEEAQDMLEDLKLWHEEITFEYFETQRGLITDYLEDEDY